jgi:hypothetical protein
VKGMTYLGFYFFVTFYIGCESELFGCLFMKLIAMAIGMKEVTTLMNLLF